MIILYGPSPLLDSLETTLRRAGSETVLRLTAKHLPDTLEGLSPGTIIYDHTQTDSDGLYHLLTGYPGWQLIGLTGVDEIWNSKGRKSRPDSLCGVSVPTLPKRRVM